MNDENLSNENTAESYIKIPTIIQDAFCRIRIPGESRQILDGIIRKTLGWRKVKDKISISQLCKITGVKRPNVIRSIKCLEDMKIIVSDRTNYITVHQVNLNVEEWQDRPKHQTGIRNDTTFKLVSETIPEVVSETILGSIRNDTKTGIRNDTHKRKKDTLTKDTLTKRPLPSVIEMKKNAVPKRTAQAKEVCVPSFSDFKKTANDFCEGVQRLAPKRRPENLNDAAKILAEIGASPDEVSQVIAFAQSHKFWKSRTLSAENFAANYDKMKLQMPAVQNWLMKQLETNDIPTTGYQVNVDEAYLKISESKTLYDLLILWAIHPPWGKYDILKEKKRHMSYALSQDVIDGSQSMEELVEVFRPSEMQAFMRECPPEIIEKYYAKLHSFDCPTVAADSFDQEDLTGNSMASGF